MDLLIETIPNSFGSSIAGDPHSTVIGIPFKFSFQEVLRQNIALELEVLDALWMQYLHEARFIVHSQ